MHSQLIFGNGMIMVGSVNNRTLESTLSMQPDEIDGAETQTPYFVASDHDAIYASARMSGAKLVTESRRKGIRH